jgi:hypothetical protein
MQHVHSRLRGKWSKPGVPHRGWQCVDIERLDELAICEMCESAQIRYAHHMRHSDYPLELIVGCLCAGHMEENYAAPRGREAELRKTIAARSKWLSRKWRTSQPGNSFLKTRDGFHIVLWQNRDGTWSGKVSDRRFEREIGSKRRYESEPAVKIAALAAVQILKGARGMQALI